MRLIMAPVADRPECARALNIAFDLGSRLGASVKGCHIRPHRYSSIKLSPEFAEAAWRKKSTRNAPVAARKLFEKLAEENSFELIKRARREPGALYSERVGSPEKIMGIDGPVTDMLVVSRPDKPNTVADLFMRGALFESGRPVLILPHKGRGKVGRKVSILWNQSVSAARAVAESMSVLRAADEVTIIAAGPEDRPGPKSQQLAALLTHHGIRADRIRTKGRDVEAELLDAAKDVGADLLVGGAYSRSRWREVVFGGTSEFLLYRTKVPVLMLHS